MAVTVQQIAKSTSGAFTNPPATGSVIIICVGNYNDGAPSSLTTMTGCGATWTKVVFTSGNTNNNRCSWIYVGLNPDGINKTITAKDNLGQGQWVAFELAGAVAEVPAHFGSTNDFNTALAGPSLTPTKVGDALITSLCQANTAVTGITSGWTDDGMNSSWAHAAHRIAASTSAQACTYTWGAYQYCTATGVVVRATTGSPQALAGTAVGVATASGDLTYPVPMGGVADGQAGASGQLTETLALSGTAAGAGDATGQLVLTLALSGQADGTGGASGDMVTGAIEPLSGEADGTGGASGDLSYVRELAGCAYGVATATGQLALSLAALSGTASGQGDGSGQLAVNFALSGIAAGHGGASGDLGYILHLAGTADGVGTAAGDLTYRIDLAGTAVGSGGAGGELEIVRPPVNDPFANPTDLTGDTGTLTLITVADTYQPGEPDPQVGTGSVWYTFTAPDDGTLHVGTSQTPTPAWQTRVDVYTGDTIDTLESVALGDLASDPQTGITDSQTGGTDLMVSSGVTYRIRVQDAGQGRFDGVIDWTFATVPVVTPTPNVVLETTVITTYSAQFDGANLNPDETITFNLLDSTSTDLGLLDDTITADDSGAFHAASSSLIPPSGDLPASGDYTLVAHTSGGDYSLPFTLDLLEPDVPQPLPTDPAPVATTSVQRWVFQDVTAGADPASWTVPINPNKMTSPFGDKTINEEGTVSPEGQSLIFEGMKQPTDWQFSGVVLDQTHYDNLEYWYGLPYRVYIVDHYKRAWEVYIYSLDIQPVGPGEARNHPWKHTYTMKAKITRGPIQL